MGEREDASERERTCEDERAWSEGGPASALALLSSALFSAFFCSVPFFSFLSGVRPRRGRVSASRFNKRIWFFRVLTRI